MTTLFINNIIILAGLEIFPVVAMLLFLLLFIGVVIYTFTADRRNMDSWSQIPLDGEDNSGKDK